MKVYIVWWGYGEDKLLCNIMKNKDDAQSYVTHWNKLYPHGETHWYQEQEVCLTKLY